VSGSLYFCQRTFLRLMLDDADTESDGIKEFLSGMKFAAAVQCFQIVRILTYCRH